MLNYCSNDPSVYTQSVYICAEQRNKSIHEFCFLRKLFVNRIFLITSNMRVPLLAKELTIEIANVEIGIFENQRYQRDNTEEMYDF